MSKQLTFDDAGDDKRDEQADELERVSARIGRAVLAFCQGRNEFHADELRAYVTQYCGPTAPGSADRILRDLRQQGRLNYEVVSRRGSLYRVRQF